MNFTFGIITIAGNESNVLKIIDSIEAQSIPRYEIIIVGGETVNRKNTITYKFDETQMNNWITRKKNIITKRARYENIVSLHDYITLEPDWYAGFLKFGNNFHVASNIITDLAGNRAIDWSLWWDELVGVVSQEIIDNKQFLLPYDVTDLSKYMYLAGYYWVAKVGVMREFPLDEHLFHGYGEDVEFSKRVRTKYNFSFNSNSAVRFLREKGNPFIETTPEAIEAVRNRL